MMMSNVEAPPKSLVGQDMEFRCSNASRIMAAIQIGASLVVAAVWYFALIRGQLGLFDRIGLPVVAILLAVASFAAWRWPQFTLTKARLPLLCMLYGYVQSALFVALFASTPQADAQAVVRLGLATPLLYLASFALLVRQAYALPVTQGVLVLLQCLTALLSVPDALPSGLAETLFVMMALQPLYLALLYWINYQRRETIAASSRAASSRMTTLAMVSHELRSPLQTIVGSLNALERRLVGLELPRAELSQVHRMRSALAQLESHLSDLLVVTKQGGGLAPARIQPFRFDLVLKALADNYAGAARDRGCLIRLEISEGCGSVEGDALRVHQVINNLVNNAVKYTQEGEICLKAERHSDQKVLVTVRDTGIGIDASKISEIWKPHVRVVTDPSVALSDGSGLGLTVVRMLVDMLGGSIAIESQPGEGTTITVELPLPQVRG